MLLPLRWETHSAPEYGKRPQEVINRQVVDQCDLLVGIFWTRIGSPTGVTDSGTLEEIERVANDGKLSMLYFSRANKNPDEIDLKQLQKLREFKEKTFPNALVENYTSSVEFRDKLARQLEIQLRTLLVDAAGREDNENAPITDVLLHFSDPDNGEPIGESLTLSATSIVVIDSVDIPDYEPKKVTPRSREREEIYEVLLSSMRQRDKDYYRTKIQSIVSQGKRKPIRFWLKNIGSVGARDVYIDIRFKSNGPPFIVSQKQQVETHYVVVRPGEDTTNVSKISDNIWATNLEMRALQPKREVAPPVRLYISAEQNCSIDVEARIYADTLAEPILRQLMIEYKVKTVDSSYRNLLDELEEQES